jgi:hypothetical protein
MLWGLLQKVKVLNSVQEQTKQILDYRGEGRGVSRIGEKYNDLTQKK